MNETLRLEITFESVNDSLNVVARINDDDYCEIDMLGLVLDRSGNGFIDVGEEDHPYMLFAGNVTYYHDVLLRKDGIIECTVQIPPQDSVYHTCTFTEGLGYTFKIHIPKKEFSHVKANMVYVFFLDVDELKGYPWSPWVSIMIEGWR